MVKHLSYVRSSIGLWLLCLSCSSLLAQSWHLEDSVVLTLPESVVTLSPDQFYVTTAQGSIIQLNLQGDTLRTYRATSQEIPLLLPWQPLRLQAFFPFQQILTVLDQNLNEVSSISLPEATIGNATLSADQQVWYISTDLLLNKYNPLLAENTLSASLQRYLTPASQVLLLREYQNRLYIQTEKQLLVFDLFGNFFSQRLLPTSNQLQFFSDEAYFHSDGTIQFFSLYSKATRSLPVPEGKNIRNILIEKEYLHGYSNRFWYTYSIADPTQK